MDLGIHIIMTEEMEYIDIVKYYRDIWTIRLHVLAPSKEVTSGLKGRQILRNDDTEEAFNKFKKVVSTVTLLNYPDCINNFTVHTDASDKNLGTGFSQINKSI